MIYMSEIMVILTCFRKNNNNNNNNNNNYNVHVPGTH